MKRLGYFAVLIIGLLIIACAKVKTPVENPAHPQEWMEVGSQEFHANKVVLTGDISCQSCHGTHLSRKDSFCNVCHLKQDKPISYPHPPDWMSFKSEQNHGKYCEAHPNELTCNRCHDGVNDLAPACSNCHLGITD